MEKALHDELTEYFERLSEAEQQSVLNLLKAITVSKNDNWSDAEMLAYNQELDEAMNEIDKGEFYSHEDALNLLKKRRHVS